LSSAIDKVIEIKCEGATTLPLESIKEFQGEFKALTKENFEKLKHTITTEGFCDPINIWENEGKYFCLDGHQRMSVLKSLRADGWMIPALPVNMIKAKDKEEAKKLILTFSSNYGVISEESLSNFMIDAGLSVDFLQTSVVLPEVSLDYFSQEDSEVKNTGAELDLSSFDNFEHTCPKCGFQWDGKKGTLDPNAESDEGLEDA